MSQLSAPLHGTESCLPPTPPGSRRAQASPPSPSAPPRARVLLHLLWAAVVLTSVWSLGRAYTSGQATASTAGAQAVWAQYHATVEFNKGVLQKLRSGQEQD